MRLILFFILFLSITSCSSDELIENNSQSSTLELKTNTPSFISQIQVDFEGVIVKTNNENILSYGMLIGEKENLTIESNLKNQSKQYSNGDTVYKGSFSDLDGDKKYFLRFYIKTADKTYYGNTVSFKTTAHKQPALQNIKLFTQQQVEAFGINNYTYVENLEIGGSVEDLSPLSSLIKIGTSLTINNTDQLKNLHGLENIQLIGTNVFNSLVVSQNSKLETLSGLNGLTHTGGLYILNNPLLQNLHGLDKLEQAVEETELTVPSFDGLPLNFKTKNFTTKGFQGTDLGNRTINCEIGFILQDAPNITNLKGISLNGLQGFRLTISRCKSLKSLENINYSVGTSIIEIYDCENFESFKGLENLKKIVSFDLSNLPKLKSFKFLESTSEIQLFRLYNVGIINFTGLNNVISISHFYIVECNELINFIGLQSLKKIAQNGATLFYVDHCQNLQNFTGLENVESIRIFRISDLPSLNSFTGIGHTKIGSIEMYRCKTITSLQGLENITTYDITINNNQNLQNFCPIKNIVSNFTPSSSFYVSGNLTNPTKQEIITNCP